MISEKSCLSAEMYQQNSASYGWQSEMHQYWNHEAFQTSYPNHYSASDSLDQVNYSQADISYDLHSCTRAIDHSYEPNQYYYQYCYGNDHYSPDEHPNLQESSYSAAVSRNNISIGRRKSADTKNGTYCNRKWLATFNDLALKKSPAAISLSGSRVNSKNQFVGYGGNNEQARQVTRRRTFSQEELSSKSDKYKCEGRKLQHGHQNVKGKTSVNNVKEYTDDSKRTTFGVEGNFDSNKTFVPGNQSLGYRLSQNSTVDHFCSVQMAHISNQAFGNGTSRAETKNQCNINTDANNNELSPLKTTQDKATYQLRSVDVTCNAESQIESNIDTSINLNCNIKQTLQTDRSSSQQALSNIYSTFNVAQDQVSDTSAMDISSDMEIEDNIICQVPIPSQNDGYCLPSSPNPNQTVTSIYSGINENGHNFISKAAGKAQTPADQVQMSDSTNARSMEHNETGYSDWKQPAKEQAALHQRNADLSGPVPRTVHSLFPVGDNEQVTIDSMDQSSKSQLVTNQGQENSTFKRKRASLVVEGQRSICPSGTSDMYLHGRSTMLKSQKRQFIDVCERDSCPRETKGQGLPKGPQKSIKKKRFPTSERGGTIVAMGLPEDQKYANCSRPERQEASMLKGSGGCREGGTFAMSEGQETEVTKKSQGDVEDLDSSVSVGQETMISKELQIQQESLTFSGPKGQTKQSDGGDLEPDSSISEGNKPMIFKESQEEVESCTVPGVGRKRFFNPKYNNPEFNITASLNKCGKKKFVSSLSMNGTSSSNCTESASDQDESNEKKSPSWDKDLADKIKLRLIEMIKDTKMDRKEQSRVYCMLLALNSSFLISDYNKASPRDRERCNKLKSWLSKAKGTWRQGEKSKMARYVLERLSIANVLGIKRSDSAEALAYVEETWRQSKKNRQSIRRSSSRKERGNARNSGQKDQHKRKGVYQRCMRQKLRHLKFGEQSYNKQMSGKESHDRLDCCAQPNYHEHYSAPGGLEERDLRQLKMDEKSSSEVTDGENIMIEGANDYIQQDSDSNDSHEQLRHEPTYKQVLGQRSRENSEIEISNHSRQSNARNRVGRASRWDQRQELPHNSSVMQSENLAEKFRRIEKKFLEDSETISEVVKLVAGKLPDQESRLAQALEDIIKLISDEVYLSCYKLLEHGLSELEGSSEIHDYTSIPLNIMLSQIREKEEGKEMAVGATTSA